MKTPLRRPRLYRKQTKKAGLAPGTLVYVGEKKIDSVRVTYIDYDEKQLHEDQVSRIEDCFEFKQTPTVSWINMDGLHDVQLIEKLGAHYELHPLILEDVLNTGQRPKFEDYERCVFVVLKMLSYNEEHGGIDSEQVSLVLGPNFVISFQERIGDVFQQIRDRIRNSKGRIRKMGADYLAYALVDAIVDSYFAILEGLGDKIEMMEDELVGNPTEKTLQKIYLLKREMISLRRSIWPLREVISGFQRSESALVKDTTAVYLRDVYDHTIQVIDTVEAFRDTVSGMLETYLSSISNKMNNVMKVLTIIATIFIPLTFVAGIYGMNFKYMPELQWRYSYAVVWLVMLTIFVGMIVYFKRKRWL
ncbi:MAG: magnesium/cobalt transporter CorA [Planctomycetota bacterium]|jgi:magnesium transporter